MTILEIEGNALDAANKEIILLKQCGLSTSVLEEQLLLVRLQNVFLAGMNLGMTETLKAMKGGDNTCPK